MDDLLPQSKKGQNLIFQWFVIFKTYGQHPITIDFSKVTTSLRVWSALHGMLANAAMGLVHQCLLGFCGATQPDHGKLVL